MAMTMDDEALRAREAYDLCDLAWGIIANAGGGDWSKENMQWRETALEWRARYLKLRGKNADVALR